MFEGFQAQTFQLANGIHIHGVVGGSGPPVLLLHGFPQTHVCWHKVAPDLSTPDNRTRSVTATGEGRNTAS
jgi:haloacetate dehalogenase